MLLAQLKVKGGKFVKRVFGAFDCFLIRLYWAAQLILGQNGDLSDGH